MERGGQTKGRIVWSHFTDDTFATARIVSAEPDGRRLDADLPDLSQARSGATKGLVVFETYGHGAPPGASQDIATVPTDCAPVPACAACIRYLTHNGAGPTTSANPGWAPDGKRVVFSEWTDTAFADIWTLNPDGSDRLRPR